MRSTQLLLALISLITFSVAWPWPPAFVDGGLKAVRGIDGLFKRQDGGSSQTSSTAPTRTTGDNSASNTDSNTASITSKPTDSSGSSGSDNSTTTEYDPRDPAGGVSMITPAITAGTQYYKVGDWVTFVWNYTSLSATPTAINVIASCSKNDATYTLAANASVAETGSVLWDTSKEKDRLLTEKYTLMIFDAAQGVSGTPKPGYLGQNQHIFAMYTPQPYTPYGSGFTCPTCSGAMSATEKLTLRFLLGTAAVTVLSFTYFAQSFSIV